MNIKTKMKIQSSGLVRKVCFGAGISMAITVILAMVNAWMICSEKMPEKTIGYGVMLIILVSSYMGSLIACKMHGTNKLATTMITGGIYMAVLLVMGVLLFDGTLTAVGETSLLVLCGCVLAAMWSSRRTKTKKYKIPNR